MPAPIPPPDASRTSPNTTEHSSHLSEAWNKISADGVVIRPYVGFNPRRGSMNSRDASCAAHFLRTLGAAIPQR